MPCRQKRRSSSSSCSYKSSPTLPSLDTLLFRLLLFQRLASEKLCFGFGSDQWRRRRGRRDRRLHRLSAERDACPHLERRAPTAKLLGRRLSDWGPHYSEAEIWHTGISSLAADHLLLSTSVRSAQGLRSSETTLHLRDFCALLQRANLHALLEAKALGCCGWAPSNEQSLSGAFACVSG